MVRRMREQSSGGTLEALAAVDRDQRRLTPAVTTVPTCVAGNRRRINEAPYDGVAGRKRPRHLVGERLKAQRHALGRS